MKNLSILGQVKRQGVYPDLLIFVSSSIKFIHAPKVVLGIQSTVLNDEILKLPSQSSTITVHGMFVEVLQTLINYLYES